MVCLCSSQRFDRNGIEVVRAFDVGMNVAVDEAEVAGAGAAWFGRLGGFAIQDGHVHHSVSFRRGIGFQRVLDTDLMDQVGRQSRR